MPAHTINFQYDSSFATLPRNLNDLVQVATSANFEFYESHSGLIIVVQKVTINSIDRRYFTVALPTDNSTVAQRFSQMEGIKTAMEADTDHSSKLDWFGVISSIQDLTSKNITRTLSSGE